MSYIYYLLIIYSLTKRTGQRSRKRMERIVITDGSGSWFDAEKAEKFEELREHDGRNYISKVTGSQWEHEGLYRTSGGKFILNHWSNFQGTSETYSEISARDAAIWLVINEHDPLSELEPLVRDLELK